MTASNHKEMNFISYRFISLHPHSLTESTFDWRGRGGWLDTESGHANPKVTTLHQRGAWENLRYWRT